MPERQEPNIPVPLVRLSDLRNAHALSLQDVCDRVIARGVSLDRSFLAKVEKGQRRASPRVLKALAAVYQLSPVDIFQPEVPPPGRARPPRRRGEGKTENVAAATETSGVESQALDVPA